MQVLMWARELPPPFGTGAMFPYAIGYADYLTTEEWQAKRDEVRELADWHCATCPWIGAIEVHHRWYGNLGHERLEDLIPLCRECHPRIHQGRSVAYFGYVPPEHQPEPDFFDEDGKRIPTIFDLADEPYPVSGF